MLTKVELPQGYKRLINKENDITIIGTGGSYGIIVKKNVQLTTTTS